MDLKPCPFCGGFPKQVNDSKVTSEGIKARYRIHCDQCGCTTPKCDNLAETIGKWQNRITTTA